MWVLLLIEFSYFHQTDDWTANSHNWFAFFRDFNGEEFRWRNRWRKKLNRIAWAERVKRAATNSRGNCIFFSLNLDANESNKTLKYSKRRSKLHWRVHCHTRATTRSESNESSPLKMISVNAQAAENFQFRWTSCEWDENLNWIMDSPRSMLSESLSITFGVETFWFTFRLM